MDRWAHGGVDNRVLDEDTLHRSWTALNDVFGESGEVIEKVGLGEGDAATGDVEVAILINAVSDLTFLDFGDGSADLHGDGTSLWVWH